jgi:transposase
LFPFLEQSFLLKARTTLTTQRKTFTDEFKREAVRLAKERGNIAQTARELGISDNCLQNWKRQLAETPENPFPGQGHPRDAELAQLQRENARLKEDNEILKKAVGIFTNAPR